MGTKRRFRTAAAILGMVMLAALAAGCGGSDDTKSVNIESDSGDAKVKVSGDGDKGSVKVETDEGTFTGGSGAEIPESFPDDFPVPDDAKVLFSGSQKSGDGEGTTVTFEVPESPKKTWEFFLEALPDAGYEIKQQMSGGDGDSFGGTIGFEHDGLQGAVVVGGSGDGKKATASVTIGKSS